VEGGDVLENLAAKIKEGAERQRQERKSVSTNPPATRHVGSTTPPDNQKEESTTQPATRAGDEMKIASDSEESDDGNGKPEKGMRKVRRLMDPKLPKEAEVEEHYLSGHMPYRSWCPHSVRGRGRERDHRKQEEESQGIPEHQLDYCFPGDEHGERLTVLVVIERNRQQWCPAKGPQEITQRTWCWN
jgi:hypothetical protein